MAKIIPIGNVTRLDLNPDEVLKSAIGHLEGVVVIGFDKEGDLYAASSYADGGTLMWLLEGCKRKMFDSLKTLPGD